MIAISNLAKKDPGFFVRIMLGMQDETHGAYDYINALQYTSNWDNGTMKDYLYNDNRIVIRFHVLLNFIAFNSYKVHALFSCFMSFIGINFLYKSLKQWFSGKETWFLVIVCFFPALWFYTGALLKEGLAVFILGSTIYQFRRLILGPVGIIRLLALLCLLLISTLLKPYLLLFSAFCFALFLMMERSKKIHKKTLVFFSLMALLVFTANVLSMALKNKSMLEAAILQQHRFVGVSKGGIFLEAPDGLIRLANDSSLVKKVPGQANYFTIAKNVDYMFWEDHRPNDTVYVRSNRDTLTHYALLYVIPESHSNLNIAQPNNFLILGSCLYYTLFYPAFFNAVNALQLLVSFENLAVLAALLIILFGLVQNKKEKFLPLVLVFFVLSLCLLIGFTAPNSGAISRYRAPVIIFLFLAALYYTDIPGEKGFQKPAP